MVRHRMVERALWGDHVDSSALVKKYVHRLRRKLEEASDSDHEFIRSVYGIGYLFVARNLSQTPPSPDPTEVLEIKKVTLAEAFEMVDSGQIKDAITLIALHRLESIVLTK